MRNKLYMIWLILRSDFCAAITIRKNQRIIAVDMDIQDIEPAAEHLIEIAADMKQQEININETKQLVNAK